MYSYTVIKTNKQFNEIYVIYQTNSYTNAEKVAEHFNANKSKYGFVTDNYKIIQCLDKQKIIDKIL